MSASMYPALKSDRISQIKNILIVDDNPDVLTMLEMGLSDNWNVHQLSDGFYVADFLRKNPVDLIILDILMPRQEGLETLIMIRDEFGDIPVITISVDKYYLDLSKDFGANCAIDKPIDLGEVYSKIAKLNTSSQRYC